MTSIQEKQINDKRNWKAETWDYDHYIPDESGSCLYCLTEKQAELLRGIVIPVAWKTRWWSSTDAPIDQTEIEQFRDSLIRRLMMPCGCDDTGTLSRYTPDGHFQTSSDGGTTWTDNPTSDPRTPQPTYPPFTPPETEDAKCTYADSIVTLVKSGFVEALADGASYSTVLGAFTAVLTTILAAIPVTVLGSIIVAVAGGVLIFLVTIGVTAFQAAMTSDVWDRFKCNIFDHMNDDGSFTESQVDALWSQIAVDESGIAAIFLQAFVATARAIGMTNAARSGNGHADADCTDCSSCSPTTWVWNTAVTPEGADVVITSNSYEADAYGPAAGSYYWAYWSASGECCDITVTGDFDPATASFSARCPCENWTVDVYATEGQPPWINDALTAPHGMMSAIKIRAPYPFRAKATFS